MESNLSPEIDLEWLKANAVRVTKAGWYYLRNHRIAIWKNGKVKFVGRWDGEEIGVVNKHQSES